MRSAALIVKEFVAHVDTKCNANFLDPSLGDWTNQLDEMAKSLLVPLVDQDLDPFSPEYFGEQLKVYKAISGRDLDQHSGELHPTDIHALIRAPNAYGSDDTTFVAEHSRTVSAMLSIADLGKRPRVLDLGAGSGVSSEILASCGAQVTALDIDPALAELARERAAVRQLPIERVVANFDDLLGEIRERNAFDAAFFSHSLHHCLRPWRLLADVRSVLTEDGVVVFSGEPIQNIWWKSWGIRLDAESLYVASKFGWFESGWSRAFITRAFAKAGLELAVVGGGHLGGEIGLAAPKRDRLERLLARADQLGLPVRSSHVFASQLAERPLRTQASFFEVVVTSPADSRYLCYGPYVDLEPGQYSVHASVQFNAAALDGAAAATFGSVHFDAVTERGTRVLAERRFTCADGETLAMELRLTPDEPVEGVELRIRIVSGLGTWKCALPKIDGSPPKRDSTSSGASLTPADVTAAYEILLGRKPESEQAIEHHLSSSASVAAMLKTLANSPEARAKRKDTPFHHYHCSFDPLAVIRAHENPERKPVPGHLVNWLGVAIDTRFIPGPRHADGVEGLPVPSNWHADVAEFGAALRAVDLASECFTMVELGCGWGCWINITGVAAKRRGMAVRMIGVEGDKTNLSFARATVTTNGFREDEVTLHHGIAASKKGRALFPQQEAAGGKWGLEPLFDPSDEQRRAALASGQFEELPLLSLESVIGAEPRVDLLHMDIQGGEADFVHDCLDVLTARVRYLVIGTHSKEIEGRLFHDLLAADWHLEVERPVIMKIDRGRPVTHVDGVQGWRNPRL